MIKLLSNMGNDNTVANAARQSFGLNSWFELPEKYSVEQSIKLIEYLAKHHHMTPFRHNALSIQCKVPLFIARQLGKHQAGLTWNEKSRRYTTKGIEFFNPVEWRNKPVGGIKQGSQGVHKETAYLSKEYNDLTFKAYNLYEDMLSMGVAPEQARMVLPQSMLVNFIWTGNLLAFAHVYNERIASGAQLEVQEFAKELDAVIAPLYPVAWTALTNK